MISVINEQVHCCNRSIKWTEKQSSITDMYPMCRETMSDHKIHRAVVKQCKIRYIVGTL